MARGTLFLFLLLAGLTAPPRTAAAESPAAEAFARGKKHFEERNYVDAVTAFKEAYRLKPHYFVLCSIARCHENLNQFVEAAAHYRRCLDEGAEDTPVGERTRKSLAKVEAKIAWLEVESPGDGGTVFVDGKEAGTAPGRIPLDPGSHAVEVRRQGARPASTTVDLGAGGSTTVTLVPEPLADKTPPPAGGEKTEPPDESPKPPRKGLHPAWFWTAAALTAVLTTTFIVLGVQSIQLRSDYEDDPTKEGYDTFRDRRRLTNVFLGLAGAAAAGGTVLFFYTDFGGKERDTDASSALLGVGLRGVF